MRKTNALMSAVRRYRVARTQGDLVVRDIPIKLSRRVKRLSLKMAGLIENTGVIDLLEASGGEIILHRYAKGDHARMVSIDHRGTFHLILAEGVRFSIADYKSAAEKMVADGVTPRSFEKEFSVEVKRLVDAAPKI